MDLTEFSAGLEIFTFQIIIQDFFYLYESDSVCIKRFVFLGTSLMCRDVIG